MDDILESVSDREKAQSVTNVVEKLVSNGGFEIKGWTVSGNPDNQDEMAIPNETHAHGESSRFLLETCRGPILLQS